MAEFSKRSEVTVETMGKVHNPTGTGVAAFTTATSSKLAVSQAKPRSNSFTHSNSKKNEQQLYATTKIEEGSSRRNIARKKTDTNITGTNYDNRKKKMGGAGKGLRDTDDPLKDYVIGDGAGGAAGGDENCGPLSMEDPLYIPEEDDDPSSYVLSSNGQSATLKRLSGAAPDGYDSTIEHAVYGPLLTLSEFKIRTSDAIREYFDSSDFHEVVRCIDELKCREYHPEVVKRAISLGLDAQPRERELVSRLLACLHPNPLTDGEMELGFGMVLDCIEDLIIDIPDAKAMIGSFLARAVIDEVLPPAFLSNRNNSHPGDPVVEKAVGLLSREHCTARLERVWGPGDGRPVSELKVSMDQLLKEYLLSRELDEAASCVRELKAAHFHHELVKRGVRIAMEEDGGRRLLYDAATTDNNNNNEESSESFDSSLDLSSLDAMAALFVFLVNNSIVSEYQVAKGIDRLRRTMEDVRLDVPAAPGMLDEFEGMARLILLKGGDVERVH